MIQPNPAASFFCVWLQTSGFYRFSPQRLVLIELIRYSAVNNEKVTNIAYNDFIRITNPCYLAYQQFIEYQNL